MGWAPLARLDLSITLPKAKADIAKTILWAALLAGALVLGGLGQAAVAQDGAKPTWATGIGLYVGGTVLFVASMWVLGRRENLRDEPMPKKLEWILFGVIMAAAIVLRVIRLDEIPAGVYIDRGFAGLGGLRILHEHVIPPLNIGIPLDAPSAILWVMAGWFIFFKNTQANLYLLVALISLSSFPFIYWFYRQLTGPRVALLGLYLLAMMRWNLTFSRNGFTCIEMMPFMFGTLALLLYGLKTGKKWAFVTAGFLCAGGIYTYQSYKAFPLLIATLALYELVFNFERVRKNWFGLVIFTGVFFAVSSPIIHYWVQSGSLGSREAQLSIFAQVHRDNSYQPLIRNWTDTGLMFNWHGDENPRHNMSRLRMLDDVSGVLFIFGVFYALSAFWRRKNYYMLAGLLVMSLPCLLSTDAAHACRMVGITPFVTLLIAVAVSGVWGRLRALTGRAGEIVFLSLLALPLAFIGASNYTNYFVKQAGDYGTWAEHSTPESDIGKTIAKNGNAYEYYVSPIYWTHFSLDFFAYFYRQHVHPMNLPDALWPRAVPPGEGVLYALPRGRGGIYQLLKSLYPKAKLEYLIDPNGEPVVFYVRVSPEEVDSLRGLKGTLAGKKEEKHFPRFPEGLPAGPYHAVLKGSFLIEKTGTYLFKSAGKTRVAFKIGAKSIVSGKPVSLIKGYYPLRVDIVNPGGPADVEITMTDPKKDTTRLDNGYFTALDIHRGLLVDYYRNGEMKGKPLYTQWEPVINASNGNDFPIEGAPLAAHWSGVLNVPVSGKYSFVVVNPSFDKVMLKIDRRSLEIPPTNSVSLELKSGPHAIDAYYLKPGGQFPAFSLQWLKPGDKKLEIIPNEVFGEIR
jgi:hypothetical protein